jgi:uncharacterized protein (DUF2132 family)
MTTDSTTATDSSHAHKSNHPLQGLTLAVLLERLVTIYGWEELARCVKIRCFSHDPSIKSSLTFLRRTPWARQQVEDLYIKHGHAVWLDSESTE